MGNRVTETSSHANIVIDRHLFAARITDHLADIPRRTPRVLVRIQYNVVNLKRTIFEFYHNRLPMLIDSHLMLTISTDYSDEHQSSQQQQWPTAHVHPSNSNKATCAYKGSRTSVILLFLFFSLPMNRGNPRNARARSKKCGRKFVASKLVEVFLLALHLATQLGSSRTMSVRMHPSRLQRCVILPASSMHGQLCAFRFVSVPASLV